MATTGRDLHKLQTRDVAPSSDLILKFRSNTLKLYASRFAKIESLFPGFLELNEKEKSLTFFKSASFVDAN